MKRSWLFAIVLACLAAAAWLALRPPMQRPEPLARASAQPDLAEPIGDTWYWLERPIGAPARLLRAVDGKALELARADQIPGYSADDKHLAWTALDGRQWSVNVAQPDGRGRIAVWTGPLPAGPPRLIRDRVYWTVSADPPVRDGGPLPPFGRTLQVWSSPAEQAAPAVLSKLLESEVGTPLGEVAGSLYVCAFREMGQTAIYRIPLSGGAARRVAGEAGRSAALLGSDGLLYWTARSPESANPDRDQCVRRLEADGKTVLLMDWLPAPGRLVSGPRGVCYLSGDFAPAIFPIGDRRTWPRRIDLPEGYGAVGAGRTGILLARPGGRAAGVSLARLRW